MNRTKVIILACVAAVLVAATALTMQSTSQRITTDRRGDRVFPEMTQRSNDVAAITVRSKEGTFTAIRNDKGFFDKASGYPVKNDVFRQLVLDAAAMTFEEAKTAKQELFGDLKVADPEKAKKDDQAGSEVTLADAKGNVLAKFIAGERESSVGGARGGQYIRLPGEERAWLVRGTANVPAPHAAWFEINLVNLNKKALQSVELSGGGLEDLKFESAKDGDDLKLMTAVPEGRKENSTNVLRVAFMVDPISFDKVRKATGKPKDDARKMVVTGRNGLKITLTSVGELKDGWVQIDVEATKDSAKKQAEELKSKVEGFEFKLLSRYAEVLGWKLKENFTEEAKS